MPSLDNLSLDNNDDYKKFPYHQSNIMYKYPTNQKGSGRMIRNSELTAIFKFSSQNRQHHGFKGQRGYEVQLKVSNTVLIFYIQCIATEIKCSLKRDKNDIKQGNKHNNKHFVYSETLDQKKAFNSQ